MYLYQMPHSFLELETFNIKLLIIQKVKQHNIKVYNFIIINNTSYKIKF